MNAALATKNYFQWFTATQLKRTRRYLSRYWDWTINVIARDRSCWKKPRNRNNLGEDKVPACMFNRKAKRATQSNRSSTDFCVPNGFDDDINTSSRSGILPVTTSAYVCCAHRWKTPILPVVKRGGCTALSLQRLFFLLFFLFYST